MRQEYTRKTAYRSRISIHAPIVGCDLINVPYEIKVEQFQSTHPSWGATTTMNSEEKKQNISIHAPIVGCDLGSLMVRALYSRISIHAPIVGCDFKRTY